MHHCRALSPVPDGSAPLFWLLWLAHVFLLETIAQEALGDCLIWSF
jgi:hypothetical protein